LVALPRRSSATVPGVRRSTRCGGTRVRWRDRARARPRVRPGGPGGSRFVGCTWSAAGTATR